MILFNTTVLYQFLYQLIIIIILYDIIKCACYFICRYFFNMQSTDILSYNFGWFNLIL